MQRLDAESGRGRDDDALLHIVCALGALFFAAEHREARDTPDSTRKAGMQWAKRAQQLVLGQLGNIVVENLMTALLLQDYHLRLSNFGDAFMLSGITARMQQALQINLEHSTDILCETGSGPSASTKESRRRLMWCCYITDSLIGNGVDQLTLIKEPDIKVQLPCCERNFLLQDACITETLDKGQFLKFLGPERLPTHSSDNIGIRGHFIRFTAVRRKVLKYIKHLNVMKSPWLPDSEFSQIVQSAHDWYNSLPASLQFTPSAMYIRKETQQLGALCSLHSMYYQTMCDLYRICAPSLYKLRYSFTYPPEQTGFLHGLQRDLFSHARNLALISAEASRHGPHGLADCWFPTVVYDCCRVLLFHATQLVEPAAERSRFLMLETLPLVRSNVKVLRTMEPMYAVSELLANAAEKMLEKVEVGSEAISSGQSIIPDEPYPNNDVDDTERSAPGTPVQSAPDYVLNPLSIYRMTRKTIAEKHMPERQPNAISPTAASRPTPSRRATLQHISANPSITNAALDTVAPPAAQTGTYGAAQSQAAFDDLMSLFASDPSGWTWQPSDTAIGSQYESNGLPPWEPTYVDQQLDAWVPMFSGQTQQQYGFQ
ncbi:uncharacterized protein LTR77_006093 [Saxophila tyrrhenica]|uniref:Xylanolytic transcriptional activator regulatory domain-containing protein n=1 Tax=Saxophila tyrrhenica TaxID=1690608 RepID=A0AAV9P9Y8_9PEZI|nr:hypothetical protein LTR77_006093 [Saxophila tyrrhenica]